MKQKTYTRCLECNTVNEDSDYCKNCGALINIVLKRRLESEAMEERRVALENKIKEESKVLKFFENGLTHPFFIIRLFFKTLHYIWLFLSMVLGGLIASILAAAAG
ncbi:hypothetical protein SAMN05444281_1897 [Wenyingzhuangia marina]|uniref:Uncharacterized protein n=2 Tax=Wenyingzhuangia marina TaxID=1195760 RepID=A0A1M5VME5_9FLAO|nr:hypothetical protein GCM10011397_12890 [Wenyingzhuangia marina]SHH76093.1 hypothetical protein SAMN05444281_1897 [Wenyingzhuangia marina]